jgi:hypothetical protein
MANINFSIAEPQQVLPLAKIALKADALGYPECRDGTPLDCLPDFPAVLQARRYSLLD